MKQFLSLLKHSAVLHLPQITYVWSAQLDNLHRILVLFHTGKLFSRSSFTPSGGIGVAFGFFLFYALFNITWSASFRGCRYPNVAQRDDQFNCKICEGLYSLSCRAFTINQPYVDNRDINFISPNYTIQQYCVIIAGQCTSIFSFFFLSNLLTIVTGSIPINDDRNVTVLLSFQPTLLMDVPS